MKRTVAMLRAGVGLKRPSSMAMEGYETRAADILWRVSMASAFEYRTRFARFDLGARRTPRDVAEDIAKVLADLLADEEYHRAQADHEFTPEEEAFLVRLAEESAP